jgi:high-affinity nickel-transport protein
MALPSLLSAFAPAVTAAATLGSPALDIGLLVTALTLGIRHGIDWDHIAAISDITSTTAAAEAAEESHELDHERDASQAHAHGGAAEMAMHGPVHGPPGHHHDEQPLTRRRVFGEEQRAILLGTLYALGHALVVAVLGLAALVFGAVLPAWVDPIMGRVVGITLLILGVWVFYSLYQYARHGSEFHLRSRWMLVFAWFRYGWRWLAARLHGHTHVEPVEMSSYGARTAFGVGMIHGIGAETGTQVLFIAAIGTAAGAGLGIPMLFAFIIGLLISNTAIVVITATGFVASQLRQRIYVGIGIVAGAFSLVVGAIFLLQAEDILPDLSHLFGAIGL